MSVIFICLTKFKFSPTSITENVWQTISLLGVYAMQFEIYHFKGCLQLALLSPQLLAPVLVPY